MPHNNKIYWNPAKLKDIVSIKTGKLNSNAATANGKYPFFTCSQETFKTDTFSFDTECVLLGGNNAAGIYPLKLFKGKFDAYQRTYIIESLNNDRLINKFLFYSLRPKLELLKSISTGAATKFLTLKILNDFEIDLPRLSTQHKIASILSTYDDLIENNTRRIQILEEMAQRIYKEWFLDFRFPGHENVKMKESELGMIPEGWRIGSVGDIYTVKSGYAFRSQDMGDVGDYGIIKIKNIQQDEVDIKNVQFISGEFVNKKALNFKLSTGDLLIAMTGATVGKIGIMPKTQTDFLLNQRVGKFFPQKHFQTNNQFLYQVTKTNNFQININNIAQGAAQPNISGQNIESIKFIFPSMGLLETYENLCDPIRVEIICLNNKTHILRQTRDLLLPKLISGKIDVTDMDIDIGANAA